jgi:hypothetical protein
MRNLGSIVLLLALWAVSTESVWAQKVGTSSLQFLKVMPTARATALGDAYVSLASGADALFWNPAGLTSAVSHDIAMTMTVWLFDTKQGAFGYALPLGDIGTFGVQVQYVDFGTIQETRVDYLQFVGPTGGQTYNPGLTGNTFRPYSYLVGLSYGRMFTEAFSAGVTAKYVRESLFNGSTVTVTNPSTGALEEHNTSAGVLLFDFGIRYYTGFRSIFLGASVQNFGGQVKFARESYPAPLTFRLGASGNLMGQDALLLQDDTHRATVAFDLLQPNDYAQQMHFGLEYEYARTVALRLGYKAKYDTEGLTAGLGVQSTFAGLHLLFDYSYGSMADYLTNVHRISLGVQW